MVHREHTDGGSADARDACDNRPLPAEMISPMILARIEWPHDLRGGRIDPRKTDFAKVAAEIGVVGADGMSYPLGSNHREFKRCGNGV